MSTTRVGDPIYAPEQASAFGLLHEENKRLRDELATMQVRLAACGVAAQGKHQDDLDIKYQSASLHDVLDLYAECKRLRARLVP